MKYLPHLLCGVPQTSTELRAALDLSIPTHNCTYVVIGFIQIHSASFPFSPAFFRIFFRPFVACHMSN